MSKVSPTLVAAILLASHVSATAAAPTGVLVMAHGGSTQWNQAVTDSLASLRAQGPVEVAFGMADACSLQAAVRKLEAAGVQRAVVVRLFVSGASFREETEQILGLKPGAPAAPTGACEAGEGEPVEHAAADAKPQHGHGGHATPASAARPHSMADFRVDSAIRFVLSSEGLSDAPEMAAVLADRARALSKDPVQEDVLVIGHGPGDDRENQQWIEAMDRRADAIRAALPFHSVAVKTLREDWPEKRAVAETEIREAIAASSAAGRTPIVIPFRVQGFGPYAKVLDGLSYVSDGQGLLPHPNVAAWIERQIRELTAADAPASANLGAGSSELLTVAERIIVTATASPRELGEVAGGASVVTRDEIETLQMRSARDLLLFESGVYVANDVSRLGLGGFVVRGVGGNRVQTQVDGIPTAEEFAFGPLTAPRTTLDVDALQSAEIVRGPASSLYGSDALGGVVSLVTREPADYLQGGSSYVGAAAGYDGSSEDSYGSAAVAIGRERWNASVDVNRSLGAEVENQGRRSSPDTFRTTPSPQARSAAGGIAKLGLTLRDNLDLRVVVESSRTDTTTEAYSLRAPVSGIPTLDYDADDSVRRTRGSVSVLAQVASPLADTLLGRAYYQQGESRQDTAEVRQRSSGLTDRVSSFDFDQQTVGGELRASKGAGAGWRHLLTYGASYSEKRFDLLRQQVEVSRATGARLPSAMPFPTKYFPQSRVGQLGVFAQDQVEAWSGKLRLVPGVRYDRAALRPNEHDAIYLSGNPGTPVPASDTSDAISPKLGAILAIDEALTLTAQYARGFRTPPYSDVNQGFTNVAFGYTALPNPDLRPETSDTYEIGLRGSVGSKASWNLNAFDSRYADFIEMATLGVNPGTGLLELQSRNVTSARIRGLELGADGRFTNDLSWRLNGAWVEGSKVEGSNRAADRPLNSIAPPSLTAGLFYRGHRRFDAALVATRLFAKSAGDLDRTTVNQFATPAATVVDLSLGWTLARRLALRAGVENLLDETYWQWGDVLGLARTSAVLDRYTSPPRSLVATLRWNR